MRIKARNADPPILTQTHIRHIHPGLNLHHHPHVGILLVMTEAFDLDHHAIFLVIGMVENPGMTKTKEMIRIFRRDTEVVTHRLRISETTLGVQGTLLVVPAANEKDK